LIQGVDLHELNAGLFEYVFAGNLLEEGIEHAVGAFVAIVNGVLEEVPAGVKQAEVNAPCVNREGAYGVLALSGGEPFSELAVEMKKIPVKVTLKLSGAIPEAVDFVKVKLLVFDMPGYGSSAGGTEVDR
jgi:hypothetical protein